MRNTRFGRRVVSLRRLLEPVEVRRTTEDVLGRGGGANLRRRSVAVDRRWWCLAEHELGATGRVVERLEPGGARIVLVAVGVRTPRGEAVSLSCRIRRRRSLGLEVPLDHGGQVLCVSCSSKNDPTTQKGNTLEQNRLPSTGDFLSTRFSLHPTLPFVQKENQPTPLDLQQIQPTPLS